MEIQASIVKVYRTGHRRFIVADTELGVDKPRCVFIDVDAC